MWCSETQFLRSFEANCQSEFVYTARLFGGNEIFCLPKKPQPKGPKHDA